MGAGTGHNGGNASKGIDERARIEPGHSIGSQEPSAPEWWPSPRYGRKTGKAPVESGTLLWPNILETLSDSVRDPPAARLPVCGRGFAGFDLAPVGFLLL